MSHVIWRLHRHQVIFAAGALAALTVLLTVTGVRMASDYHLAVTTCGVTGSCGEFGHQLFDGDGFIIDLVTLTLSVPLLFGLFWGAPLVAKELEDRTQDFAWTQSVTRRRWMSTNVAWAILAAAVWGAAMSGLVTWWRMPENALSGRFAGFDAQGLVPVAYSVFAVALGIAAGTWLKRLLPAIATTLGVFVVLRGAVALYLRPHLLAPIRHDFPLVSRGSGAPSGAWILSSGIVGPRGNTFNGTQISSIPAACRQGFLNGSSVPCMSRLGYRNVVTYQPDSRFWAFQGMESALFVVLAAALLLFAYWRVSARDA